ncbi:MAG TPA: hypothetical protein VKB27_18130 [Gammaproteobacteria bacterium]|nr:hypothetical protein [Gammaproteobacteria bacterium]
MTRVDNKHNAIRWLAVLAVVFSETAFPQALFCTAEQASGFVYDPEDQSWKTSSLPVEDRRYLVSPANDDNLVARALKFDYEVTDADSSKAVIQCRAVRLPDSNEETGLIMCKGSFGASFNIDRQSGRYVRAQTEGYVTRQTSTQKTQGPYLEIGNCTPQ